MIKHQSLFSIVRGARSNIATTTARNQPPRQQFVLMSVLFAAVLVSAVVPRIGLQPELLAQTTTTKPPVKPPAKTPVKTPVKSPAKTATPSVATVVQSQVPADVAPDSTHPYRPGIDVRNYVFDITLPKTGKMIDARATVMVWRRMTVDTLVLDLVKMTVDSVQVGRNPRAYVRDSATIRIPLVPEDGAEIGVRIKYHGEPTDGLIITENPDRGWSAFGDNWPNRARYWLPTVDHPSDKATVAFNVDAPAGLTVVANGALNQTATGSSMGSGNSEVPRTRYMINEPIPTYLMVIAAAKMERTGLRLSSGSEINQAVYTFPAEKSYMPGPFAEAGKIVEFFAKTAGPFVYEQLNHFQSATRFGGMENATAIFYSDNAFKNHTVSTGLIAHETAHQWFGDAVTPRRWQDVWLSEGFASYFAPLYVQHSQGDSAFRASMTQIRAQILAAPVVLARPVVDTVGARTPNELLNANSYQKGAFVLHMLRSDIGDDAFFQGIRDYQNTYRNSTATTENLRVCFEKAAGASLVLFFNQWLHQPGYADLAVSWKLNVEKRTVTFTVHQSEALPPFTVPLVVLLRDAAGIEERHTLHIQPETDQTFEQPLSLVDNPTVVVLDPNVELLAKLKLTRR
ncbi:MAG: M1 family metallopeptidase [Gemmatimonas sp.]